MIRTQNQAPQRPMAFPRRPTPPARDRLAAPRKPEPAQGFDLYAGDRNALLR